VTTYIAIALGCFGILIGIKFRIMVLVAIVNILLIVTIIVCAVEKLGLAEAAFVIFFSQALTQGGYLVGTLLRSLYDFRSAQAAGILGQSDKRSGDSSTDP
jgi:hypothetical protein